jgi:hypothetical protein
MSDDNWVPRTWQESYDEYQIHHDKRMKNLQKILDMCNTDVSHYELERLKTLHVRCDDKIDKILQVLKFREDKNKEIIDDMSPENGFTPELGDTLENWKDVMEQEISDYELDSIFLKELRNVTIFVVLSLYKKKLEIRDLISMKIERKWKEANNSYLRSVRSDTAMAA